MTTILETERLLLRPIDPDKDFDAWARAFADEATMRYLGSGPLSRASAWRSMAAVMGHWQIRGYGFFSVIDKASGDWVGRTGPWFPEGWPEPEVGWLTAPWCLRKGYAAEAGRASIDYAFRELGWTSVAHVILDGNVASTRVAESLGSRYIETLDGLPGVTDGTVHLYRQTRS